MTGYHFKAWTHPELPLTLISAWKTRAKERSERKPFEHIVCCLKLKLSNGSCCHLPRASNLQQLLKITLEKRLQGRKASLPALSQNQDQMLSWNPEPPPAGPYMKTGWSWSIVAQRKLNIVNKCEGKALALDQNHPEAWTHFLLTLNQSASLFVEQKHCEDSVRWVGTYSVAWFHLCSPQEPLDSDAIVRQLTLEGSGLSSGHGHILQRPHQANHSGFGLGRRHG